MTSGAQRSSPSASVGLVRGMGRWTLVAMMVNGIVGSGILGLPSKVHALAGPWGLLAYVACAVIMTCVTLCFAEVASRFSTTGGPYLYARRTLGSTAGFVVGWLLWIARVSGIGAIGSVMASYVAFFWPPAASDWGRGVVLALAIVILTVVNVIGVKRAAGVLNALTIGKLVPLVLFVAAGAFFFDPHALAGARFPAAGNFSKAMLQLVFAFSGFEAVVIAGAEMKEPQRDLPFALITAMIASTVLYLAIQTVCLGALPDLAASQKPLADASVRFMGAAGASLIAIGAVISTTGTMGGSMLFSPRILYAMAEHEQLPAALMRTHVRFRTPHVAILATAIPSLALALSGTFTYLVTLSVLGRLSTYVATAIALLVLRRRGGEHPARFELRGGIAIVAITLAACAWLIAQSGARELRDFAIAVAIGLVWFGVQRLVVRRKPAISS